MDLSGTEAELCFTIEIIRAATGNKEVYQLVGKLSDLTTGEENGSNTHNSGTECRN